MSVSNTQTLHRHEAACRSLPGSGSSSGNSSIMRGEVCRNLAYSLLRTWCSGSRGEGRRELQIRLPMPCLLTCVF